MQDNRWMYKAMFLGVVFFLSILLIKPIGVSTQFSVLSGIVHSTVDNTVIEMIEPGTYISSNAYYAKSGSKVLQAILNPVNYDFIFVLAIPLGAYLAAFFNKKPVAVTAKKNVAKSKLFFSGFIGGFLLLYGARMAGGCTSGHMMSGIMQGSISGFAFAMAVFAAAIPTAIVLKEINKGEK